VVSYTFSILGSANKFYTREGGPFGTTKTPAVHWSTSTSLLYGGHDV
jgi:hypothetical protein